MKILAHRGYWRQRAERNTREALQRAFDCGWGVETDVRDSGGQLVIAHDMPQGGEMTLEQLLQLLNGRKLTLALNIKADGLSEALIELLKCYEHEHYFAFDMSIPELVLYIARGVQTFSGLSDIMPSAPLLANAQGIWLDCFKGEWYESAFIDELFKSSPQIALVSPELHGRPYHTFWNMLLSCRTLASPSLYLCTDHPDEAQNFFGDAVCP